MNPLSALGARAAALARALVPDPFVLAIGLCAMTWVLAWAFGPAAEARNLLWIWDLFARGMFEATLLGFGFQMALMLVAGHALAEAPPVRAALVVLAGRPRTPGGAAAFVAGAACCLGWLNWGLALVGAALLAREVARSFARRGQAVDPALLGAAAYLGLLVWHGGLSGSAPLAVATAGPFGEAIAITHTLLSGANLGMNATLAISLCALFYLLGKNTSHARPTVPPALAPLAETSEDAARGNDEGPDEHSLAGRLERSPVMVGLLAIPLLCAIGFAWVTQGAAAISLPLVILGLWALGIWLHGSARSYARAFHEGARGASGILLQFPLYFGILAVLRDSGMLTRGATLLAGLADGFAAFIPAPLSAAWLTFGASALLNLFVPSGGGQWALQAPLILESATRLGISAAPLVLAFAWGDELTNMMQPFWALPLLAITGLRARDIFGYTLLAMLVATPVMLFWLVFATLV